MQHQIIHSPLFGGSVFHPVLLAEDQMCHNLHVAKQYLSSIDVSVASNIKHM